MYSIYTTRIQLSLIFNPSERTACGPPYFVFYTALLFEKDRSSCFFRIAAHSRSAPAKQDPRRYTRIPIHFIDASFRSQTPLPDHTKLKLHFIFILLPDFSRRHFNSLNLRILAAADDPNRFSPAGIQLEIVVAEMCAVVGYGKRRHRHVHI